MSEKLQKILAHAGLGSRRTIETWIAAGRVTVNGTVANVGDRIESTDAVCVDGKKIRLVEKEGFVGKLLIYHKPEGEVCTRNDPQGRPTVFDRLPPPGEGRWINVGRLDINTSGLLLFTNDGELANYFMHPKSEMPRVYLARIRGRVSPECLARLREGVMLEDGLARFDDIQVHRGEENSSNHWYSVRVHEGRNRLVRRLWESQELQVSRLTRVQFGDITLPRDLKAGQFRMQQ